MLQIGLHTYSSFKHNVLLLHRTRQPIYLVYYSPYIYSRPILDIFSVQILTADIFFSDKRFPNAKFTKATVEHFYSALMRSKRQKSYFMQLVINVCVRVTYGDMCMSIETVILYYHTSFAMGLCSTYKHIITRLRLRINTLVACHPNPNK